MGTSVVVDGTDAVVDGGTVVVDAATSSVVVVVVGDCVVVVVAKGASVVVVLFVAFGHAQQSPSPRAPEIFDTNATNTTLSANIPHILLLLAWDLSVLSLVSISLKNLFVCLQSGSRSRSIYYYYSS